MRPKTYSYLTDNSNAKTKNKKVKTKTKDTKKCAINWKPKSEDYKNCSKKSQIEDQTKSLESNKCDVDSPRENHKELIKNKKLI